MLIKLLKLIFARPIERTPMHIVDGKVFTEEVRDGFVYLRDRYGFVTQLKDERGFYVRR